jgi:hypothetical protein
LRPKFDFPDETASPQEVEAAVRADPVINAWRLRWAVGLTLHRSEALRARGRAAGARSQRLLEIGELRRFLRG